MQFDGKDTPRMYMWPPGLWWSSIRQPSPPKMYSLPCGSKCFRFWHVRGSFSRKEKVRGNFGIEISSFSNYFLLPFFATYNSDKSEAKQESHRRSLRSTTLVHMYYIPMAATVKTSISSLPFASKAMTSVPAMQHLQTFLVRHEVCSHAKPAQLGRECPEQGR